ncbi:unnamed protein product [Sphenostylis stenocarpa]|uniref:Uncharacterized protein n=1 Tax=Sphenostylis stenocarpa TaxID=92480 RepID=A0AA86SSY2_9FABA|nr:unnamed protein product [Sphenostylis stenocarpa]
MKGTSKFIMGATLVMVVSLAIVLGLILVLLAELYCSLLLQRRQLRKNNNSNTTNTVPISATQTTTTTMSNSPPSLTPHSPHPPFTNVYSQGVLQAPRSFLFPCKDEPNATPRGIGLVSVSSLSPLASFLARAPPPQPLQQANTLQGGVSEKPCGGGVEHLVYISNPIYENEFEGKASGVTPFETPHTSPSRFERSGSSGEDDDRNDSAAAKESPCACANPPPSLTPPLTPMKKLPAEGSSVSLRDATSLASAKTSTPQKHR